MKNNYVMSEQERAKIIKKEREEKERGLADINSWLKENGYNYQLRNYTAVRFDGSREDNESVVKTIKFIANYKREHGLEDRTQISA